MPSFAVAVDDAGLAIVTWDAGAGRSNVFNSTATAELEAIVARIADEAAIRGAVFVSGATDFCVGEDVGEEFAALGFAAGTRDQEDLKQGLAQAGRLSRCLRRLETCGKPVAAAIRGRCLDAGLSVALACHYRIASDEGKVQMGFPLVRTGAMPSGGATQRLARLVGARQALDVLLRGTVIDAARGLALGLVHALAPASSLLDRAKDWIRAGGEAVQPWDRKDFQLPGCTPYSAQGFQAWPVLNALYRKETYDNYEGLRAILQSAYEGLTVRTMDAALGIEARHRAGILASPRSRRMVRSLYSAVRELEGGARRPPGVPPSAIRTLGIVGTGFMGAGIAFAAASAGLHVVLLDRDRQTIDRAKESCAAMADKAIARASLSEGGRNDLLSRIVAGDGFQDLSTADLVIEAVFEARDVKSDVLPKAAAALKAGAVLASNTSTLPISGLAEYAGIGDRFIGIHFFSPVDRMRLVEIIPGRMTSPQTLAVAFDFVRAIGKTPIIVNDARGFFTSRVVMTHKKEGIYMLEEGVPPALIENAGRAAGMPVGPLALADEVALDLSWKILQATRQDLGDAYEAGPIDRVMREMVERRGRFGRKNGKGFYDYPERGRKRLWPGISEICPALDPARFSFDELKERLLLIQALETVRCLDEGVLADVREADVGAIFGFAFAPFTGGPLSYIDGLGAKAFLDRCRAYAKRYGRRYEPPKLLVDMARKGGTFYDRFPQQDAVA